MARMKHRNLAVLVASTCIGLASFIVGAQSVPVTIMPFGDSITAFGAAPESSYRYWLWQDLQNAGFTQVTFIGNQSGVAGGGGPANTDFDQSYEGGGDDDGIDTATGLNLAQSDAAGRTPGIVLLELGANDAFESSVTPGETETNLEEIIQALAAGNASVIVLISTPPRFMPDPTLSKQEQNQERTHLAKIDGVIGKVVSAEKKAGVDVVKVSLGGYNPRTDTIDGTHPNVKGEQYIAKQFFTPLKKILAKM